MGLRPGGAEAADPAVAGWPALPGAPGGLWNASTGMPGANFKTAPLRGRADPGGWRAPEPEIDGEPDRGLPVLPFVGANGAINDRFTPSFGLEADAGYSLDRQIEYERIGQRVKFESAPYFRVGMKFGF